MFNLVVLQVKYKAKYAFTVAKGLIKLLFFLCLDLFTHLYPSSFFSFYKNMLAITFLAFCHNVLIDIYCRVHTENLQYSDATQH